VVGSVMTIYYDMYDMSDDQWATGDDKVRDVLLV